jgi:hypothetical protein
MRRRLPNPNLHPHLRRLHPRRRRLPNLHRHLRESVNQVTSSNQPSDQPNNQPNNQTNNPNNPNRLTQPKGDGSRLL